MGILRILLAIAVVLAHSGPIFGFSYLDGTMAVQSFFIVSGFYMSMILTEKYKGADSYVLFISNRLLRLFPTYLFVALLTLISVFVIPEVGFPRTIQTDFKDLTLLSRLYVIAVNLLLVGQDTAMFLGLNSTGALHFTTNFVHSKPMVFMFLLCPQAWSLSLELIFYFIAPFLVRKKISFILFVMLLSLTLRLWIYHQGLFADPWTYRFFPTELFYFLLGCISYRIYGYIKNMEKFNKVGSIALWALLLLICVFNYIAVPYTIKQSMFYLIFAAAIPFVFNYTKKLKFDRFIGELSYPIYLTHFFIINFVLEFLHQHLAIAKVMPLLAVVFSILFSILIGKYLIKPIDNYRERRVGQFKKGHL